MRFHGTKNKKREQSLSFEILMENLFHGTLFRMEF